MGFCMHAWRLIGERRIAGERNRVRRPRSTAGGAPRPSRLFLLLVAAVQIAQGSTEGLLDREVSFDIPPGSLELALLRWSAEAHVPIALDARLAAHLKSPGLAGRLRVGAALAALLRDSGLAYITVGETVTVMRAPDPPKPAEKKAPFPSQR